MKSFLRTLAILLVAFSVTVFPASQAFSADGAATESGYSQALEAGNLTLNLMSGEDDDAPALKSAQVQESTINAGSTIHVRVKVEETGTGLEKAYIQLNSNSANQKMLYGEKLYSSPVTSTGTNYIEFTFNVATAKDTLNGEWFIAYLELFDAKGNYSRYCGSPGSNDLVSDLPVQGRKVSNVKHVVVKGGSSDAVGPVINSIETVTKTVEKPGNLRLSVNITEASGIDYVQFDLCNENGSDHITKLFYSWDYSFARGTHAYTFDIPISQGNHIGQWYVSDVFLKDTKSNDSHYTTQMVSGKLVDYYDNAKVFAIPSFTVAGLKGDETEPALKGIQVAVGTQVEKPGMLQFDLNIVEDGAGISNIEVEIGKVQADGSIDAKSRVITRYCASGFGHSDTFYSVTGVREAEIAYDKPLKTGKYTFRFPVPSQVANGRYQIVVRELKDAAENAYVDYADEGPKAFFTVTDEFTYAFEVSINNPKLLSMVKSLKAGQVGRILLLKNDKANIMPKAVLGAIAGKNVKLVCYRSNYQWIFDGMNIKKSQVKDLSLATKISTVSAEKLGTDTGAVRVEFSNNGALPGKVEFRFKSSFLEDYYGKESSLRFYHVDQNGSSPTDYVFNDYDEVNKKACNIEIVLDSDAWCYVDITHNSSYILSPNKLKAMTMKNARLSGIKAEYQYTGKNIEPSFTVRIAGKKLAKNKDYTVSYSRNKNVGTATVKVKGAGKYKKLGTKKVTFKINPKGVTLGKLSASSKKLTVKWTPQTLKMSKKAITGYQIQYSTNKSFKSGAVLKTVKGSKKASATMKSLKSNTKYYVRIRTYLKAGKKQYCSSWSKAKSAKVK